MKGLRSELAAAVVSCWVSAELRSGVGERSDGGRLESQTEGSMEMTGGGAESQTLIT